MKITTIVSLAIGLAGWQATVQARDAVPQTRKGASPAVAQASPDGNMVLIPASQARDIQRAAREVSDCVRIEDDMSRLGCYDEVMARRLPQPDRELPKLKAWGLRMPAAAGPGTGWVSVRDGQRPAGREEHGRIRRARGRATHPPAQPGGQR